MASANLVAYNAGLKDTYTEDHLEEQLQQGDDTLAMIESTRRFHVGNEARTPLHTKRNPGSSMLGPGGGTLNAAGNQGSAKATWQYKNAHAQIAIEGETIDGTSDDAVAVATVTETEVSGALNDLRQQLIRQLFGDGSAIIATCLAGAADTTVLLDPVTGWNAIERGWIFEGALLDVGTVANPVLKGTISVVSITESETAPAFVASASVTEANTDQVSYKGSRTAAGGSFEMNGFRNIVSQTADLGNLTVAGQSQWKAANVDLNGGTVRPLTLPLMYRQQRKVMQKTQQGVDFVTSSYKQQENFYNLLQAQAQFEGDMALEAGNVTKAKFAGMGVKGDLHCPNEDMYFGMKSHLFNLSPGKPYWQNKHTGGDILTWIQGTDSYGAKITYRLNIGTNRRNAFARLGDLA